MFVVIPREIILGILIRKVDAASLRLSSNVELMSNRRLVKADGARFRGHLGLIDLI